MTTRSWRMLTGSAALATLMLFAAPVSAQFYDDGFGYGEEGYGDGYRDHLNDYYNEELGDDAGYYEDYTEYYEDEEGFGEGEDD